MEILLMFLTIVAFIPITFLVLFIFGIICLGLAYAFLYAVVVILVKLGIEIK